MEIAEGVRCRRIDANVNAVCIAVAEYAPHSNRTKVIFDDRVVLEVRVDVYMAMHEIKD